jgi:hypothetical protein
MEQSVRAHVARQAAESRASALRGDTLRFGSAELPGRVMGHIAAEVVSAGGVYALARLHGASKALRAALGAAIVVAWHAAARSDGEVALAVAIPEGAEEGAGPRAIRGLGIVAQHAAPAVQQGIAQLSQQAGPAVQHGFEKLRQGLMSIRSGEVLTTLLSVAP